MDATCAQIIALADRVLDGGEITKEEGISLINTSDENTMLLMAMADKIRQKYNGHRVDFCAIINGRSGRCPENCAFCAQSSHYNTGVKEYPLLDEDVLVDAAKKAKAAGAVRFSIVTSGRNQGNPREFENIVRALKRIRAEVGIEICCSLGLVTKDQLQQLKDIGVTRYHSNPLNILNPIKGTPFENNKSLSPLEILRAFAVFRFILPRALIRTAGGREVNLRDLQAYALNAGLNGIMVGGYLTTGGRDPKADRVMVRDLGLGFTRPVLRPVAEEA